MRRETERTYWRGTAAHTYLHRRWRTWWELPKAIVGRWVWAGGRARRQWWARWQGKQPWRRPEPGCRWTWPSWRRWCRGFLRRCHPPDKPALLWSLRHTDAPLNIYAIWITLISKMGFTVTEIVPGHFWIPVTIRCDRKAITVNKIINRWIFGKDNQQLQLILIPSPTAISYILFTISLLLCSFPPCEWVHLTLMLSNTNGPLPGSVHCVLLQIELIPKGQQLLVQSVPAPCTPTKGTFAKV